MIVICETVGCANEGIAITFVEATETVSCGPCGQPITNIEVK
jgi:ribosomal protein S27E